jgi:hypothetical protein
MELHILDTYVAHFYLKLPQMSNFGSVEKKDPQDVKKEKGIFSIPTIICKFCSIHII